MAKIPLSEADFFAKLEGLELEARRLAQKRDATTKPEERRVAEQQVKEVEDKIASLRRLYQP